MDKTSVLFKYFRVRMYIFCAMRNIMLIFTIVCVASGLSGIALQLAFAFDETSFSDIFTALIRLATICLGYGILRLFWRQLAKRLPGYRITVPPYDRSDRMLGVSWEFRHDALLIIMGIAVSRFHAYRLYSPWTLGLRLGVLSFFDYCAIFLMAIGYVSLIYTAVDLVATKLRWHHNRIDRANSSPQS